MPASSNVKAEAGSGPGAPALPAALVALAVLCLALLLRLAGAAYGGPAAWLHSADEHDSAVRAIQMGRGDLLPVHASKPTFYPAILAGTYGAWYGLQKLRQGETAADFEHRFFREPFGFCLLARLTSVAASMATLAMLAWGFRTRPAGEMLWVLIVPAFGGCSVFYGHVAKEDALGGLLVLCSFACTAGALRDDAGRNKWLALAFACAGLAVATKYNCFFAVLFPALAAFTSGGRPGWRVVAGFPGACAGGFLLGVPYALLHPVDFLGKTFGSAIFSQVVGGWNILLYDDHHGPGFLWKMFFREFGIGLVPLFAALAVLVARRWRAWLWALLPAGVYLLVLACSRQLDYQYVVPLTPVLAWLAGEGLATVRGGARWPGGRLSFALALACAAALLLPAWRTASGYSRDTRLEGAKWLSEFAAGHPDAHAKPLLIVSGYMGFYYPPLDFDAATFERLAGEARASGGAGGYFDRAAANADPHAAWLAHFLEIRTGFRRLPDGARQFQPQPFSVNIEDYRGKYSAVIIPEWTDRIVARRAPELDGLNRFVDALRAEGVQHEVLPEEGRMAGPRITICAPP